MKNLSEIPSDYYMFGKGLIRFKLCGAGLHRCRIFSTFQNKPLGFKQGIEIYMCILDCKQERFTVKL